MKNKISLSYKIALFLILGIGILIYGQGNAEKTHFDVKQQGLKNNFSTIHFNAGWNDFGGGALRVSTQKKLLVPKEIEANGKKKLCSIKLEGIYYNSQRGERLRPLDEKSLESLKKWGTDYDNLKVYWWLYTNCWTGDEYSIYGYVQHTLPGEPEFSLSAGVNYNIPKNRIQQNSPLNCTLQLVNNKTPVGYLYDYQGGIGFVGGNVPSPEANEALARVLEGGSCITDIFIPKNEHQLVGNVEGNERIIEDQKSLMDLKRNLAIRGIVGFTNEILNTDKVNVEQNFWEKSQVVRTDAQSLAHAVNSARKKSEQLCRGKRNRDEKNASIHCFDENASTKPQKLSPGHTYIFRNTDLKLTEFMNTNAEAKPVSVFIDKGKLILPTKKDQAELIWFNDHGYPARNGETVRQGNFLKGNFIINGLVYPENNTGIQNKLYVHGKLLSFNTYDEPTQKKVTQIKSLLGNIEPQRIDYRNLFIWNCSDFVSGISSDGTPCGKWEWTEWKAALAVIDMDFASPLIN